MTTSELFKKHFGGTCAVSLTHPNIENFFEELNQVCLNEDKENSMNIITIVERTSSNETTLTKVVQAEDDFLKDFHRVENDTSCMSMPEVFSEEFENGMDEAERFTERMRNGEESLLRELENKF